MLDRIEAIYATFYGWDGEQQFHIFTTSKEYSRSRQRLIENCISVCRAHGVDLAPEDIEFSYEIINLGAIYFAPTDF